LRLVILVAKLVLGLANLGIVQSLVNAGEKRYGADRIRPAAEY
jgi:hypothetical protein